MRIRSDIRIIMILSFAILVGVPSVSFAPVDEVGTDTTFDIATWNPREFPLNGTLTISYLTVMIRNDLELDLIVVQEIFDTDEFDQLRRNLNGWDGLYSPDFYSPNYYIKTGILWDTDKVELGEMVQLFADEEITRPPIMVPVTIREGGFIASFNLVVWHLKAGGANSDLADRRLACALLKEYVDNEIENGGETRWLIGGDFNDTIDDPPSYNAFTVFLDDPAEWTFLTEWMADVSIWASHIESGRMIDHFLATSDMVDLFESGDGSTLTLRLDREWDDYQEYISDHRPVGCFFQGNVDAVSERPKSELPPKARLVLWPVPANGAVTIDFEVPYNGSAMIEVFDMNGRRVTSLSPLGGKRRVTWNPGNSAAGIYFVRLSSEAGVVTKKAVILK